MQIFINWYDTDSGFYDVDIISYNDNGQCIVNCYMSLEQLEGEEVINPEEI